MLTGLQTVALSEYRRHYLSSEMSTSPRYVQSKPASESKEDLVVEWTPLQEIDLGADADELLCYFARYPVERNHPRAPVQHPGIKRSGEVVVCNEDDSLPKVFAELITQGFLSSPVVSGGKYKHFVDMFDIVKAVLFSFGVFRTELGRSTEESSREADYSAFVKMDRFTKNTTKSLLEQFKKDEPVPPAVHRGYSLLHPMEIMARENARRIPIVDPDGVVKGIITNSMVISLFDQNIHRLGSIRNKRVTAIMGGLKDVIWSCRTTDTVLDSFKKMSEKNVTGLAVIDHRGVLVDNLSIRDLRIIGDRMQHFLRLYLTVATFKQLCREEFTRQTPAKPIYVQRTDTVEDVIRAMDDGNLHRIWVVNLNETKDPIPIHVITQRDLMRFLLWQIGMSTLAIEDLKKGLAIP